MEQTIPIKEIGGNLRSLKKELEESILFSIKMFEEKTGLDINGISMYNSFDAQKTRAVTVGVKV